MSRKSLNTKERTRLFSLYGGICHICEGKITVGDKWEVEHIIPWEISRDDSDENRKPAHVKCHRVKTDGDIKTIRKVQRIERKHLGIHKPKSSFATNRNGAFKKRMDGSVERR